MSVEAQDPTTAQVRFDEGVEHLRAERYEDAAAAFRESYRLEPSITTMCNLALTFDRWGGVHRSQAVRAYRTCARDDQSEQFRAYAEQRVGELERELALEEDTAPEELTREDERVEDTAPIIETPSPPQEVVPRAERGPELLIAGITVSAVAIAPLLAAIVLAMEADATVTDLRARTGGMIVEGSPEHDQLIQAQAQSNAAIGLYVATAIVGATGVALLSTDLGIRATTTQVALSPTQDGVLLSIRGELPQP